jgi:hypothetical protein
MKSAAPFTPHALHEAIAAFGFLKTRAGRKSGFPAARQNWDKPWPLTSS